MAIISAKDLHKIYKLGDIKVTAINGIDFSVKKGEFVSIMGPSGSGKSTLLHLIGILDSPTKGHLVIKGTDIMKLSDKEKTLFRLNKLGFVFQFYSLLPELNAIENVYIPQMLLGKKNHELRSAAMSTLSLLGIEQRAHSFPHQLSGGEQQRVSIARALVNKPEILLADEPTAALDSKNAAHVFEAFRNLTEKIKQTIIIVTHEENLGAKADRGIWLKDGQIVKEKTF